MRAISDPNELKILTSLKQKRGSDILRFSVI